MADFMWYTYSFEGRIVVVWCGVLIKSVGWVVSLDYRKLCVLMPVEVGFFYGSVHALSCLMMSHMHFTRALYMRIAE